jgi:hypothetical protein
MYRVGVASILIGGRFSKVAGYGWVWGSSGGGGIG